MNPNPARLLAMFPNASASTVAANPQLMAPNGGSGKQKAVQGTLGGKKRGSMNKTEADFSLGLEGQKRNGEIRDYKFESVKVRIGEGCWYCPDFVVQLPSGEIIFKEVKGFLRDDARVKFLAAKEQHQWAEWEMWRKDKKSGWTRIL